MDETIHTAFGLFHFAIIFAHQHGIPIMVIAFYYALCADTIMHVSLHFMLILLVKCVTLRSERAKLFILL